MPHLTLIGDSILDNAPYVESGKDVTSHLRSIVPGSWDVTLLAVDGSTLDGIESQLKRLPQSTTHIIFSCGGNDALAHLDILARPASMMAEALIALNGLRRDFLRKYERTLESVVATDRQIIAFTIYHPLFDDPQLQSAAEAALCLFNDGITRTAFSFGVDLVDLRCLFDDPGDMANPIEPSDQGGRKIADLLHLICSGKPPVRANSTVFAHRQ